MGTAGTAGSRDYRVDLQRLGSACGRPGVAMAGGVALASCEGAGQSRGGLSGSPGSALGVSFTWNLLRNRLAFRIVVVNRVVEFCNEFRHAFGVPDVADVVH